MATIFNPPKEVEQPKLDFRDFSKYEEECQKYREAVKKIVLQRKSGKHIGEILRFQVADGYAEYMVANLSPVQLVHIPLGDAWEFEYAHLFTKKEVVSKIEQQEAIKKLFGG